MTFAHPMNTRITVMSGSVRNRVSVGDGNEAAWEFYRKFGFYPRMTVLEQKKE